MTVYSSPEISGITLVLRIGERADIAAALRDATERLQARAADIERSGRRIRDVRIEVRFD